MKVSKNWLQELVDLKVSMTEVERLLPLRTIALKDANDQFFELDMKGYNRADLLSMRGVAYEVAAITDSTVKFTEPDPTTFVWADLSDSTPPNSNSDIHLKVTIEDEKLAPVYCLAKIEGLKVGPSSSEWIQKLLNSGMRTVNNIADVTNLVMLEYGQPLHSFDASQVKDETIIVRTAKAGEVLETLDQKKRQLTESDLLITDPEKALGLAGVMGGKNSEITDRTTTILLEAAIFDPANLRKTSARLGLQSEAGKRFYHGLTKKRLLQALDAAIKMYQELGGKLTAISLVGDLTDPEKSVSLTAKKTNNLIGTEISDQQIEAYLNKLHFSPSPLKGEGGTIWEVTPPYYRLDIEIEEDLIEEVARMYGYENIPSKALEGELPAKVDQSLFELIYKLKTELVDQGFTEIQTYSFFSTQVLKNFDIETSSLIRIANPISSETEFMRNNLWFNLVEKAGENLKYFDRVAIFEIGKTYEIVEGKIVEEYRLALLLVDGTDNPLAQLNQVIKKVLPNVTPPEKVGHKLMEFFHPNRHLPLLNNEKQVGGMAEIHPRFANKFGVEKRIAIAEIKIQRLDGL